MGKVAAASIVAGPIVESAVGATGAQAAPLTAIAGPDRVTVVTGKTYLNAYAGYGPPPRRQPRRPAPGAPPAPPPEPPGPPPKAAWSKVTGPGTVTFADATAPVTTATFSAPGAYQLKLTLDNGETRVDSALNVKVVPEPKLVDLLPIYPRSYRVDSPLWNRTVKTLIVNWIPHCIDQINRTDLKLGPGGIDNFVEAAKALAGQPHGAHKGYVFSNAWVHQTVEAMSIALMVDPKGDAGDPRGAREVPGDARGLDSEDPGRAGAGRVSPDRVHAARPGALGGALVGAGARQPRGLRRGLLHRVGHQSLHDDEQGRRAAVQRGEEAGRLLVRQPRAGAEEGVVRRPPGDGAGAGALRPVRQPDGGRRPGRPVRPPRQVPARLAQGRHRVRPEPPAGHAAVRGGRPRGPRRLHLLRHGRRRRRNPRRGLPERRPLDLGQHRQPEVLRHGRRGQRRDRPRGSGRTTRCATTRTASRARAAARSSSSGR